MLSRSVIIISGVALLLLYFLFDPATVPYFPRCIFHSLTGCFCPGCGSQRAIHQLLHGNLSNAMHYNALMVVSIPLLLYTLINEFISIISKRKQKPAWLYHPWTPWLIFAITVLFWILRNLPWHPFTMLSPPDN